MKKETATEKIQYWLKVFSLGMIIGLGIKYVEAWTEPTATPSNGGVLGPITSTAMEQIKAAPLGVRDNFKIYGADGTGFYRKISVPNSSGSAAGSDFAFSSQNANATQLVLWNNGTVLTGTLVKFGSVMGRRDSAFGPTYFGLRNQDDDYFIASRNDSGYKFNQLVGADSRFSGTSRYKGVLSYGWNTANDNNGSTINKPMINIGDTISSASRINTNVMLDVKGAIRSTGPAEWLVYNINSDRGAAGGIPGGEANPNGELIIGSQFLVSGWGNSSNADENRLKWLFLGDSTVFMNNRSAGIRTTGFVGNRLANATGLSVDMFHNAFGAVFNSAVYIGDRWDPFRPTTSMHPSDPTFNIPFSDEYIPAGPLTGFPATEQNIARKGVKLQVSSGAIDAKGGLILENRASNPANNPTCSDGNNGNTSPESCTDPGNVTGRIWVRSGAVNDTTGAGSGEGRSIGPVGVLENGKWCVAARLSTGEDVINCTANQPVLAEDDPRINTLVAGKWCTSDGRRINCNSDLPPNNQPILLNIADNQIFYSGRISGHADYWEPNITYRYSLGTLGSVLVGQIFMDLRIGAENTGGSGGRDQAAEFYYEAIVEGTSYTSAHISGLWGHGWTRLPINLPPNTYTSGTINIVFHMKHGDDDVNYTFYAKDLFVNSHSIDPS